MDLIHFHDAAPRWGEGWLRNGEWGCLRSSATMEELCRKQGCLVSCICLPTSSGLAPERWLMAKMLVGWLAGWLREDTQQGVGMRKV